MLHCLRSIRIGYLLLLVTLPLPSFAMDVDSVISIGYDPGGDKLLNVIFTNGDSASIRANEGINVSVGAMFYHTSDLTWQTQATFGVKYMPVYAHNGQAEWTTYPIELIGFYNTNLIRFGAGLVYQLNPHVDTGGAVSPYQANMDSAFGYIAQIGFRAKKRQGFSVDLRYTAIRYSGDLVVGGVSQIVSNIDGSSAGVQVSVLF